MSKMDHWKALSSTGNNYVKKFVKAFNIETSTRAECTASKKQV